MQPNAEAASPVKSRARSTSGPGSRGGKGKKNVQYFSKPNTTKLARLRKLNEKYEEEILKLSKVGHVLNWVYFHIILV
jgi:hypothetical protein